MSHPEPAEAPARPTGFLRLLVTIVATAWIVTFAVFVVWARARTYQLGYEVAHASAEQSRLVDEHHSLQLERTTLRSPTRVGRAAASRMGLRPARPDELVRLSASRSAE